MIGFRYGFVVVLCAAVPAPLMAQPALERLERQLQAPSATPPPAPSKDSGYLGLITSNDTGGFIRVVQVVPEGPAALAGLRTGDQILSIDGRLTRDMNDLAAALQGRAPGQRISLTVMRGQEERTLPVTLGRRASSGDGPVLVPPQASTGPSTASPAESVEAARPVEARGDAARLDLLERRMAELERRLAELERLLSRRP